jgi:hypothetical protein
MKAHGRVLAIVSCFLAGCSGFVGDSCRVEPQIFCEPYAKWEAELSPHQRARLLAIDENHMPVFSWKFEASVRGDFGLWRDNEVTRFFAARGVSHPDYMSRPFIEGFVGYLKRKPVDMDHVSRKYWAPPVPPPPPPPEEEVTGRGARPNNSSKPTPLRGAA